VGIEDAALDAMKRHRWPGNVRELSNVIEGAFTFGSSSIIKVEDLTTLSGGTIIAQQAAESAPVLIDGAAATPMPSRARFDEMECDLIRRTLEKTGGNKSRAAQLLGISRKRLYSRIERYGLT
jgi:DNA-binding NtrC family response regulator